MPLVSQVDAYSKCGVKIMDDLLHGNAIVLFAYGLSGSGKTFTVFGPDSPQVAEAWFKHHEPHSLWGIFPRLAFELFKQKQHRDGWRITMKYFQNVVDTIRDLLSPLAQEKGYKVGMKKDKDGFVDVEWCQTVMLESWEELTKIVQQANTRKAIAPTQFNHQSTRGHCMLVLTVEFPHPTMKGIKQKGRVYVCDLAGTEPAADIVYASYQKKLVSVKSRDGTEAKIVEWKYLGPHRDQSKTKLLQNQGKKINLSLSEMAQFFMKMAQAVKLGTLKAGQSIPGCNTYFLCKFLKDTMLQAKTYLFCAIRPEVCFHRYTFATLQFAVNASVIKLKPKMATTSQSKREMQLLEELEKMRRTIESLEKEADGAATDNLPSEDEINDMMVAKQNELRRELETQQQEKVDKMQHELQQQKDNLLHRGIHLSESFLLRGQVQGLEEGEKGRRTEVLEVQYPYLINIDEDSFRDRRFVYLLDKKQVVFGNTRGDVRPMNLLVVNDHCAFKHIKAKGQGGEEAQASLPTDSQLATTIQVRLIRGKGEVFHNGKELNEKEKVELHHLDRLVLGQEILLFLNPTEQVERDGKSLKAMTASEILQEYYDGKNKHDEAYQQQARKLLREKEELEEALKSMRKQGQSEAAIKQKSTEAQIWKAVDETMLQTLPVIRHVEQLCKLVKRTMLTFKLSLQQPKDDVPSVKVHICYLSQMNDRGTAVPERLSGTETVEAEVFVDPFELQSSFDLFKDQIHLLKSADVAAGEHFAVPYENDIISELFDTSYHFGSCTNFLLHCSLNMETDAEDIDLDLMKSVIPYNKVGELEVFWIPQGLEEGAEEVLDPTELLGKKWKYLLRINKLKKLTTRVTEAYVEYEFHGERFVTETISIDGTNDTLNQPTGTREISLCYERLHLVEEVTQDFLTYLDEVEMRFNVFIKPAITVRESAISTTDIEICQNLGIYVPQPSPRYETTRIDAEKETQTEVVQALQRDLAALTKENEQLKQALKLKEEEAQALREKLAIRDQGSIQQSRTVQALETARETDRSIH